MTIIDSISTPSAFRPAILCPICGNTDRFQPMHTGVLDYITGEAFDIRACQSCKLGITVPSPAEAELGRYYPLRYRGNRHSVTGQFRIRQRRRAVQRLFPSGYKGRLLDVGAGDGSFALAMQAAGWQVAATEIDAQTIDRLRQQGIDAKSPEDAAASGFLQPFDVVTAWHVLEHIARPGELSAWVARQLNPDGFFQATVPNIASLQARIFGRQWMHLDVPRHLFHFTPKALNQLLTQAGLTPVSSSLMAIEYDWFGIIQSALNPLCRDANVLFDRLTKPPGESNQSSRDVAMSYLLGPPIAAGSLIPMLIAWLLGDGATLTITAKTSAS